MLKHKSSNIKIKHGNFFIIICKKQIKKDAAAAPSIPLGGSHRWSQAYVVAIVGGGTACQGAKGWLAASGRLFLFFLYFGMSYACFKI